MGSYNDNKFSHHRVNFRIGRLALFFTLVGAGMAGAHAVSIKQDVKITDKNSNILSSNLHMSDVMRPHNTVAATNFFKNMLDFYVSPKDVANIIKSHEKLSNHVVIVDVRDRKSYDKKRVVGAIHMDYARITKCQNNYPELTKVGLNIVYCYSKDCILAESAAACFNAARYPTKVMRGGFKIYKKHHLPIDGDFIKNSTSEDSNLTDHKHNKKHHVKNSVSEAKHVLDHKKEIKDQKHDHKDISKKNKPTSN